MDTGEGDEIVEPPRRGWHHSIVNAVGKRCAEVWFLLRRPAVLMRFAILIAVVVVIAVLTRGVLDGSAIGLAAMFFSWGILSGEQRRIERARRKEQRTSA